MSNLKKYTKKTIFCAMLFLSIFLYQEVSAVSVTDEFECRDNLIYKKGSTVSEGICTTNGDGAWTGCPTTEVTNQFDLSKIQASIKHTYDSSTGKYNIAIENLKGLQIQIQIGGKTINNGNLEPTADGKLSVNNVPIGTNVKIILYVARTAPKCANSMIGTVYTNTPPFAENTLYSSKICVDFRNKYGSNSLAKEFVPECFEKTVLSQYNTETVQREVQDASSLIDKMNAYNTGGSKKGDKYSCDFYSSRNTGSGSESTFKVETDNPYWDLICTENYDITYNTPRAVVAGDGFDYQARITVKKSCYPYKKATPSGSSSGSSNSGEACRYGSQCRPEKNKPPYNKPGAGPSEFFDECIKECDGGKYTQDCINKCYSNVYEQSEKKDNLSFQNQIYQNGIAKFTVSRSGIFDTLSKTANAMGTTPTGWYITNYNNSYCKIVIDERTCTLGDEFGNCLNWIDKMATCTTPHGATFPMSNQCSGNSYCEEVCYNCDTGCKDGGGEDTGGDGSCEGEGDRVLQKLISAYDEIVEELENGVYGHSEGSGAKFEGSIIDSYTNKKTNFSKQLGTDLFVDTVYDGLQSKDHKKNYTFRYTWECETECPEPDDGGSDGPGASGGGSSYPGGGACGPGCVFNNDNNSSNITYVSTKKVGSSDGETCYEEADNSPVRHQFDIQEYNYETVFTIRLAPAYISALNGTTIYGAKMYDKLSGDKKNQYYSGGSKYYTSPFSPIINDFRKWPTYPANKDVGISKNDPSLTKNILENYVVGTQNQFKISLECFYGIINTFCVGCEDGDKTVPFCDPQKDICDGGIQYIFRRIDLDNMFPNDREPRWNWSANAINTTGYLYPVNPIKLTQDIETRGYSIYSTSNDTTTTDSNPELDYEVVIDKQNIKNIRQYNKTRSSYQDYDMYCYKEGSKTICKSKFLGDGGITANQYMSITARGLPGCNNQYGNICKD